MHARLSCRICWRYSYAGITIGQLCRLYVQVNSQTLRPDPLGASEKVVTARLWFVPQVSLVEIIRMMRAVVPSHRVLVDVVRDRWTYAVTDLDCAWVVHPAANPAVVTVRACLRNAGVRATRLTGSGQLVCFKLKSVEKQRSP